MAKCYIQQWPLGQLCLLGQLQTADGLQRESPATEGSLDPHLPLRSTAALPTVVGGERGGRRLGLG